MLRVSLYIFFLFVWGQVGQPASEAQPVAEPKPHVKLELVSVTPLRGGYGYLDLRFRLKLSNLTERPIYFESTSNNSGQPYFVRYYKLAPDRKWIFVGHFWDSTGSGVLELKPGESLTFEDTVDSIASHRSVREEGIPVRGYIRAELPYYSSYEDARRANLAERTEPSWALLDSFRVEWPREVVCLNGFWPIREYPNCPTAPKMK